MQESVPARLSEHVNLSTHPALGILDDAIREHLELIRSHGTADSEVQRLEDEAFGPPTRPDEADFPESEDAQTASGNGVATEPAADEVGAEVAVVHEDVTTLLPAEDATEQAGDVDEAGAEVGEEEPEAAAEDLAVEPEEEGGFEEEEAHDDEPAAEEHAVVDEAPPESQEDVSEEALPAEEGTSFFDQTRDELDIDLDLQLEEEPPAAEPPSAEPPSEEQAVAEPEGTRPLEPPIESLDTVEHPFPDEVTDSEEPHEEASPSDEYEVAEETTAPEQAEEEGDEEEEDAEDVLADTPEFLKDAPEDDELWFEQGKPKDFDF